MPGCYAQDATRSMTLRCSPPEMHIFPFISSIHQPGALRVLFIFNRLPFNTQQFHEFISCTEEFGPLDRALVEFYSSSVRVTVRYPLDPGLDDLSGSTVSERLSATNDMALPHCHATSLSTDLLAS